MKTDEVEERAARLSIWLEQLREIKSACDKARDYFLQRGPNRPGDSNQVFQDVAVYLKLVVPWLWYHEEMWQTLLEGLERAIDGEQDPFRLKAWHRKPAVPRADRIKAVIEVLNLKEGKSLFDALLEVAGKFGVSERTIRDWYDDPETRACAELNLFLDRFHAQHPSSWSPEDLAGLFDGLARIKTGRKA